MMPEIAIKVTLGAVMLICGVYYFGYAFRNIDTLTREEGVSYLILGMSLMASGILIALASGLGHL